MVAGEALGRQFVAVLGATLGDGLETGADLDPLDRVDAHHRMRNVGVETIVYRLAPAHRHAAGDDVDACADRIAGLAQVVHEGLELGHDAGVRREEGVAVDFVPGLERNLDRPEPRHVAPDHDAVVLRQPLARDRPGRHPHGGLTRRRPTAAAVVADAVLVPVRIVGMARTESLGDRAVVLRALVLVADQERDRRARGPPFEHPRQDLDAVRFAALSDMARGPWFAPVEFGLDLGGRDLETGRASVDDAADRRTVGFAERGNAKEQAVIVAGHGAGRCVLWMAQSIRPTGPDTVRATAADTGNCARSPDRVSRQRRPAPAGSSRSTPARRRDRSHGAASPSRR